MKQVILKVEGMSCGHCVNSVEGALKQIGAVGKVDLQCGKVDVTFDESNITVEKVKEAIEEQGYNVV